ncbi:MAG: DUF1902 domain-containing protein [Devosia sp.]
MVKRLFTVNARWDDDAKVYYSESDIVGLHIEAGTLDEFEALMLDLAPGLVIANHVPKEELATTALEDLVPTILWQRPSDVQAAA